MMKLWKAIKAKVDEGATPMQEGDWAAMEALLNEGAAASKGSSTGFKLGIITLLMAVGASGVYYLSDSNPAPQSEVVIPEKVITPESVPGDEALATEPMAVDERSEVIENQTNSNSASMPVAAVDDRRAESVQTSSVVPSVEREFSNESSEVASSENVATNTPIESEALSESGTESAREARTIASMENASDLPQVENEDKMGLSESSLENEAVTSDSEKLSQPSSESDSNDLSQTATEINDTPEESEEPVLEDSEAESDDAFAQKENSSNAPAVIHTSHDQQRNYSVELHYELSPAINSSLITHGIGAEIGYHFGNWSVQTGMAYLQTSGSTSVSFDELQQNIDTSYTYRIDTTIETRVTETWVITGYYQGQYVYDTTYVVLEDTVTLTQIDTTVETVAVNKPVSIRTTYFQIPILAGYNWRNGPWEYGLQAGVNFRSVTWVNTEFETTSNYALDAVIRPTLRYHWNDNWNAFVRLNAVMPLTSDPLLGRSSFTRIGLMAGVGYRF